MDEVGPSGDDWYRQYRPIGTDTLSMALGKLRGSVGLQVGELAATYSLDVSVEHATIVPGHDGWFFEKFDGSSA